MKNKPRIMFDCSSLDSIDYERVIHKIVHILSPLGYTLGCSGLDLLKYKDSLRYYEEKLAGHFKYRYDRRAFEIQPQDKKVFYTFSDIRSIPAYEIYIIKITAED